MIRTASKTVQVKYVKYDGTNYDDVKELCDFRLLTPKEKFVEGEGLLVRGELEDGYLHRGSYVVKDGWDVRFMSEKRFLSEYDVE